MRSSARLKSISLLKESISHLNLESKAGARLDRKCANVGEGRHREAARHHPAAGESPPLPSHSSLTCVLGMSDF